MDRPNNLMVIVSLLFLESEAALDDVRHLVQKRIIDRYPVFSQRPVDSVIPFGLPSWEDDPHFSLDYHIRTAILPAPGDDESLQAYIDEHIPMPLDRAHPLWEISLITGYGSGSVVLCRFHHALADGIALTRVLLSMTDDPHTAASTGHGDPEDDAPDTRDHNLVRDLLSSTATLAKGGWEQATHLTHTSGVADALGLGVRTSEVVADLLLVHNADNVFNGTPGVRKKVAWTRPFPLADVKKVGRRAKATLNDVLLSVVAGALHTYQIERGAEPVDLVTMVPVNVRPPHQPLPRELGNQFALFFFTFPSALSSPRGRLTETKKRMDWLKASPEAFLTFGLISAIGRTTRELERHIVDFFANKAIGVTTNVAGPTTSRTFAGVPITSVLGWVPGSGTHTVGICIFTYAGTVRIGFMVDAGVVPDPAALSKAFEDEMESLVNTGTRAATSKEASHPD
jgi:WS/DGAT/MGAT family acyltransferase